MRRGRASGLVASTVVLVAAWAASAAAEVALKTQAWENNDAAFEAFAQQIRELHPRNLLARRTVRVIAESGASEGGLQALFDGEAGQRGGEGRVMIGGQPSVIDFYLGEPKTITEIGAMTFNVDTRTNQDYEVRFCDNSAHPGVKPEFPEKADLTTGEKILGPDRGGFQTRFAQSGGGPLLPGKADWVQFRIWRTYDNRAGEPAKSLIPGSSSAYIELQVLGVEADVVVPTPAELALRKAFQQAPKAPTFVEKPTWPETMIANREAIFAWEAMQDTLAASRSNALLGPWYVLGPLAANSAEATALRKATEIDLAQRLPGRDGQEIGWEKREDLADGQIHDLTGDRNGDKKKDVFFLCRSVVFVVPPGKNEYAIEVNADQGSATWLPSRKKHGVGNSFELSRGGADLGELSGTSQFLLELQDRRPAAEPFPLRAAAGLFPAGRRRVGHAIESAAAARIADPPALHLGSRPVANPLGSRRRNLERPASPQRAGLVPRPRRGLLEAQVLDGDCRPDREASGPTRGHRRHRGPGRGAAEGPAGRLDRDFPELAGRRARRRATPRQVLPDCRRARHRGRRLQSAIDATGGRRPADDVRRSLSGRRRVSRPHRWVEATGRRRLGSRACRATTRWPP